MTKVLPFFSAEVIKQSTVFIAYNKNGNNFAYWMDDCKVDFFI